MRSSKASGGFAGTKRPNETLASYVVKPQLRDSFDAALSLFGSAVKERTSKAALLHGSFGSGKSHFMAILYQLLQHDANARSVADLAPVVAKHRIPSERRFSRTRRTCSSPPPSRSR